MSQRSHSFLAVCLFVGSVLLAAAATADQPTDSFGGRLATYDRAAGESYFALCITPQVRPKAARVQDVVVLVDTSASQSGLFRSDSLQAVETLLKRLDPHERVKLVAVDLEAVPMTDAFVTADGAEMKEALQRLASRAPLGATDMILALHTAVESFAAGIGENPRTVVYVGDGVSRANLFGDPEIKELVDQLVERQISVSSYAIGAERNVAFLAVLANQTGGMIYVDSDDASAAQQAGASLARSIQLPVLWPQTVQFPAAMVEHYPVAVPPLRLDRDTVLIGKLESHAPQRLTITAEANGVSMDLVWDLVAERSNEDFAFLPQLVDGARDNGGLTLPTVGSDGLREVARLIYNASPDLSMFGACESEEVELRSPMRLVSYPQQAAAEEPPLILNESRGPVPGSRDLDADADLFAEPADTAGLLEGVEADRAVRMGKIQAEVGEALNQARKDMGTDAVTVRQNLKAVLDNLDRSPDIDPDVRSMLRDRVVTAIRQAERLQVENDEARRRAQENMAIADEARRLTDDLAARRQRTKHLMDKFDALIDEGIGLAMSGASIQAEENFDAAIDQIADPIQNMMPLDAIGVSARMNANLLRQLTGIRRFRQMRHRGFVNALYEVERAAIPFPDEPPIIYPDPEFWERISHDRQKYKAMDLLGGDTKERRIYDALNDEILLEFNDAPLSEVMDYLKTARNIPIIIDRRALDDVGLGSDTPVSVNLNGITLRSALKLMLKELDLTYVIRDEVLKITTPEEAETELLTKVYPVADLVLPIISGMGGGMMGGMGGGMMGGMGGGMGGMGGGMGGMGGGMGGMGGGMMGGMGGMFDVEDVVTLGSDTAQTSSTTDGEPAADTAGPIDLQVAEGESHAAAWLRLFEQYERADGEQIAMLDRKIRATARELSDSERYEEIVVMLQSAVLASQAQPWMYEAMAIAMVAGEYPDTEVERALMSAVDMSQDLDVMMEIAMYMARLGLDRRALHVFRDVASANPLRHEPYAMGLACAKRLDDLDGLRWASLGILSQAWPQDQSGIEDRALRLAKATVARLRDDDRTDEADAFEQAIEEARVRDVTVSITWTGEADVDMVIEEPAGTVCSLQNPRTTAGGVILGDAFSAGSNSQGYTETYVCPQGFNGQYRLLIRRVWGKVTAGKVTVDIHTNNPDRPHIHAQVPLGEKDALVLFDVAKGRRTEQLTSQQLAHLQAPRANQDRSILSRQLNRYEDSLASREFDADRARQRGWRGGGPVGFQPQITTLPAGTGLSGAGALAVVSADRRYVRVAPIPMFSAIGEVNTFNFGGGPTNDLPDDDDDDNAAGGN